LFRGPELTRLMSMIFMLAVLFMLIQRARTPDTWRWLVGHSDGQNQVVGREDSAAKPASKTPGHSDAAKPAATGARAANAAGANPTEHRDAASSLLAQGPTAQPSATSSAPEVTAPTSTARNLAAPETTPSSTDVPPPKLAKVPPATGPTDEDPDEAGGALEDFDAINDRTIGIEKVEMAAYERITRWVINQPEETLAARVTRKNPSYGEFLQSTDDCRGPGKIYQIDLNVRMMTKFDDPIHFNNSEDDPHDPVALYDLWGATDGSIGRLYQLVVYDPPEGMPIGTNLQEDVRFVGYFFKLQGYEPGRALPGHKLLVAPTFIGRIVWKQRPPDVGMKAAEWLWVVLAGGALLLGVAIWGSWLVFGKRKHNVAQVATDLPIPASITIDEWLDHAQTGDAESVGEETSDAPPADDVNPGQTNGHANGHGAKGLFSDGPDGTQPHLN
jgi:hypothetical protein